MKTIIFLLIVLLFTSFVVMKEIVENDVYGIFLGREKNRNISVKLQLNNDSTFILNYGRSFCNGKWYLYKNKIYLNCNEPEIYEAISSHFMPKSEFVVLILKKNKLKILQNHNNNNLGYQNIILKRQVAVKFLDAKYNNLLNTNSFSTFCSTLSLGLSMNFKFSIIYEHPIYDTSRLGVRSGTKYLVGQINQGPLGGSFIAYPSDYDGLTGRTIGLKQYELTDHLGNVRVIFGDRLAFTHVTNTVMPEILAVNNYYPFGMIIRSLSWQSDSYRWGFGGHEKDDEVKGTGNHLSFGGYGYDPRLGRRPRPDPVDQVSISNYSVFRNNPIRYIDPTGTIWKDPELAERLKRNIEDKITALSIDIDNSQAIINQGGLSAEQYSMLNSQISENCDRISNLNISISDINVLGADQNNIHKISTLGGDKHFVRQRDDGIIYIETSSYSIAIHEITHIRQSLDAGGLRFSEGKLTNVGSYLSPSKKIKGISDMEIEAYKMQYSFDKSFPGDLDGNGLKGINVHSVGGIMNDGQLIYPEINDYSVFLKEQLQNILGR